MRIISPFKDYYDSAAGYDAVAEPVWVRETEQIEVRAPGGRSGERYWQDEDRPEAAEAARRLDPELVEMADRERYGIFERASPVLLGFCGALARGWRLDEAYVWSASDLLDAIEAAPDGYHMSRKRFLGSLKYEREDPAGLLARPPEPFDPDRRLPAHVEAFRLLDCPCFLLEIRDWWAYHVRFVRNPALEPLGFARVLDPWSARQAVETFLGNELARQVDPMQDIADRDLRDMKGFDDRSFKADPGGPGRKRKKRKA